MKRWPRELLLGLIRAYQRWISPAFPRRCKYEPTCSAYAVEAVRELGAARGTIVALWRLARCNPLSSGGIDDLEDRRLFRRPQRRTERLQADPTRVPRAGGDAESARRDPGRLAGASS